MDVPPDLVGRRVALRHRLRDDVLTDAVGELVAADADAVVVHTRRGAVRVGREAVVAVRAIPPPVARRPSWAAVAQLENLCADAWPARVDRRLGAWRLRAAGGFTGRANAALAVGDPGLRVPAALDAARAFAAEHGVSPRVQVPVGSPWDRAVEAEGWVLDAGHTAGAEVAVLVVDVDRLAEASAGRSAWGDRRSVDGSGQECRSGRPDGDHGAVTLLDRPSDAWWALALGRMPTPDERLVLDPGPPLHTAFGFATEVGAAQVGAMDVGAMDVGTMDVGTMDVGAMPVGAARVGDRGAGVVRAAVVDEHLHLSRLSVRPEARRAGTGTRLVAAAAAWGRTQGARWAVLQVALHAEAARALYARLGATEHHRYRYLVPPA